MLSRSNSILWGWIFLAFIALFSSCKTTKRNGSGVKQEQMSTLSYETFGAKTSITMGGVSVGATLRVKKDSCLFLSVQPFAGVEVARLFATNKEVVLVDRFNKRYAIVDLASGKDLKGGYEKILKVGKLQALLTNRLFLLNEGDSDATIKDFSSMQIANSWLLQYADPKSRFNQEFTLDESHRVKSGQVSSADGSVRWDYAQVEPLEDGLDFPREIKMVVTQSSYEGGYHSPKSATMEFSINYKKIELNKDYSFSNPIPKGYEKVTAQEILSLLNIKR